MCNGGYLLWNVFVLESWEEIRLNNYFFESSFKISIWNRVILAVPTLFRPISYLWSGLEPPSFSFDRFSSAAASILSDLRLPVWFPPAIFLRCHNYSILKLFWKQKICSMLKLRFSVDIYIHMKMHMRQKFPNTWPGRPRQVRKLLPHLHPHTSLDISLFLKRY